jgi:hypothetical protein
MKYNERQATTIRSGGKNESIARSLLHDCRGAGETVCINARLTARRVSLTMLETGAGAIPSGKRNRCARDGSNKR